MITSVRNAKIADAVKLKKRAMRDRAGKFLVEGAKTVGEALGSGAPIEVLFHTDTADPLAERARAAGIPVEQVTEEVMGKLASTVTPQGVVAVSGFVDISLDDFPSNPASVAVLSEGRDPGNAGTILRSADAAGSGGVVFGSESVDVYNPKTVRASAGSLFHLPFVRNALVKDALVALRKRGAKIYAASAEGSLDLFSADLSGLVAFVFGNEARGLPKEIEDLTDATLRVPLAGRAESLNLAAAATLCLFEHARAAERGPRDILENVIAGAAHDIRSPVAATKNFAFAMLAGNPDEAEREAMLQGIVLDSDRLDTTLRMLVDAAGVVGGRLELQPERVRLAELIEKIVEFSRQDPDHPEISWMGEDLEVFADPSRLRNTILAFIEAEVWFAHEDPIEIRAGREDAGYWVETFRLGTRLTKANSDMLFRPRRPGSGGGGKIGLFVAKGIAESVGGEVSAEVEQGLRLRLRMPEPVGKATTV
ncbi:MAG: TrmH family RNA methyltransferase [Actinomycetota bacterium]